MVEQIKPRLKVGNSYPPDKLALRITTPSGYPLRFAEDEHNPNNILSNLKTGTEIPGGYKSLNNVLNRMPQRVWPDLQVNSDVVAYLASGKHIFEGYIDKAPNVSGPQASITPSVLGYQSLMEDNEGLVIGWISKDQSRWKEAPAARKIALGTAWNVGGPISEYSPAGPDIRLKNEGIWTVAKPLGEMWFDAGPGILIGAVNGNFQEAGNTGSNFNFQLIVSLASSPTSFSSASGNYHNAVSGEFFYGPVSGTPPYRYVLVDWYYSSENAGAANESFDVLLKETFVRSTRGLNFPVYNYGTFATFGLKAKDMLVDLFTFAQQNGLEARAEDIDDDGFIIQEAWYDTRSMLSAIVKELIKYGWYDWFFYKGKRFSYKKPGTYGRTWKTTVAACNLNEDGQESTRAYDKCIVQWTAPSGELQNAGPIGSGCTYESKRCESSRPSRTRTKLLTAPGPLTETTGFEISERFLEEAALEDTSGSATISGYVMDENGYFHPVSEVRGGDHLEVTDAHDRTPRKIVNTDYTHQQRQNQLDLAAPASGMVALLERLEEAATAAGVG